MKKLTLIVIALVVAGHSLAAQISDYRGALRLYEKGLFARSKMIFDNIESETDKKADPAGYSLLCDVRANVPGYENRIDAFLENYPYSVLIPQVRFYHALNLFDAGDYKAASEQFAIIDEGSLYRDQRTEFIFKSAYCNLENGSVYSARDGFREVESGKYTDYTAPSRYALGYIEYNLKDFEEAISWFEKAAAEVRFKEMAEY